MVRILGEDDYRRRLDQAAEISTGEEVSLLLKGILTGDAFGPLNARKDILSLSQIKSGHIDDGDRPGSGGRQWCQSARRRGGPEHPCSMTNECAWRCSNLCTTAARDVDGARRTPQYDQHIPCGLNRSGFLRRRFARVSDE